MIAHSESYAAADAATAAQAAKFAGTSRPSALPGQLRPLNNAASARWCWLDCVFHHLKLIPEEHADKFVRSVPTHLKATRREITDAFAMAFAPTQLTKGNV